MLDEARLQIVNGLRDKVRAKQFGADDALIFADWLEEHHYERDAEQVRSYCNQSYGIWQGEMEGYMYGVPVWVKLESEFSRNPYFEHHSVVWYPSVYSTWQQLHRCLHDWPIIKVSPYQLPLRVSDDSRDQQIILSYADIYFWRFYKISLADTHEYYPDHMRPNVARWVSDVLSDFKLFEQPEFQKYGNIELDTRSMRPLLDFYPHPDEWYWWPFQPVSRIPTDRPTVTL